MPSVKRKWVFLIDFLTLRKKFITSPCFQIFFQILFHFPSWLNCCSTWPTILATVVENHIFCLLHSDFLRLVHRSLHWNEHLQAAPWGFPSNTNWQQTQQLLMFDLGRALHYSTNHNWKRRERVSGGVPERSMELYFGCILFLYLLGGHIWISTHGRIPSLETLGANRMDVNIFSQINATESQFIESC